jgi:hypothetical protein
MNRCLGRKPHNAAAVAAAPSLRYAAEAPPPVTLDRSRVNYQPQAWGNTDYPSCTVAGLLNGALASEALSTNSALNIAPLAWMPFYCACAGCAETPAAIGASDGAAMLDVLARQRMTGFDIGLPAPLTGDFGVVGLDRLSIARGIAAMGWIYAGIDLSQADMDAPTGAVWEAWTNPGADVGGHALVLWGYTGLGDQDAVIMGTWGSLEYCAWARWDQIAREAYAVLFSVAEPAGVDTVALAQANAKWLTS